MPLVFDSIKTPVSTFEVETEWMIGDADGKDFTSCMLPDSEEDEAVRRYNLILDCVKKTRGSKIVYPNHKDEPWVDYSYEPNGCGQMNTPRKVRLYWWDTNGRKWLAKTDGAGNLLTT
jgi:hypothetical protein